MTCRIVILLLVSSAAGFLLQEIGPVAGDDAARAPVSVVAAADPDDDRVCGECPWPQPETDRRHQGALFRAVPAYEPAASRRAPNDSPKQGLGPVLSSLSDSLILGRPPPAVSGRS